MRHDAVATPRAYRASMGFRIDVDLQFDARRLRAMVVWRRTISRTHSQSASAVVNWVRALTR